MTRRILSVCIDRSLLVTRHVLLREAGYGVVSATGPHAALIHCSAAKFELVIMGPSLPRPEKQALLREIWNLCSTPVLSLYRKDEGPMPGVDYSLEAGEVPQRLLALLEQIFQPQLKKH